MLPLCLFIFNHLERWYHVIATFNSILSALSESRTGNKKENIVIDKLNYLWWICLLTVYWSSDVQCYLKKYIWKLHIISVNVWFLSILPGCQTCVRQWLGIMVKSPCRTSINLIHLKSIFSETSSAMETRSEIGVQSLRREDTRISLAEMICDFKWVFLQNYLT